MKNLLSAAKSKNYIIIVFVLILGEHLIASYQVFFKYLSSAKDQDLDPLDPEHFGLLDPDPQKYADPRIWIQDANFQLKTANKNLMLSNPKSVKKEIILKISSSLNGSASFGTKKRK